MIPNASAVKAYAATSPLRERCWRRADRPKHCHCVTSKSQCGPGCRRFRHPAASCAAPGTGPARGRTPPDVGPIHAPLTRSVSSATRIWPWLRACERPSERRFQPRVHAHDVTSRPVPARARRAPREGQAQARDSPRHLSTRLERRARVKRHVARGAAAPWRTRWLVCVRDRAHGGRNGAPRHSYHRDSRVPAGASSGQRQHRAPVRGRRSEQLLEARAAVRDHVVPQEAQPPREQIERGIGGESRGCAHGAARYWPHQASARPRRAERKHHARSGFQARR